MKKILGQEESVEKYYTEQYLNEHKYYLTRQRTSKEVDFLISALGRLPESVCDLACGNGRHLEEFAKRGVKSGIGVEPNKKLLNLAQAKLENFEFRNETFGQWQPYKKYDLVYTLFSSTCYLLDNAEMLEFIKKMFQSTKKEGIVVIDTENILPAIGQMDVEYINRDRRLSFNPEKMTIESEEEIEGEILRTSRRYYLASELIYFFELAGMRKDQVRIFGDFDQSQYKLSSERVIATVRL
jgi:SAM-dependent methyltransferase